MEYGRLVGLQAEEFQHPSEKVAYDALRKVPHIDEFVALFLKYLIQIQTLPEIQGDCLRVTAQNCPELYRMYCTALERLDMPEEYPLYSKAEYQYNACAYGGGSPFIVVNSSTLCDMDEGEMLALLGHEIGHIKGAHSVYHTMAIMLNYIITSLDLPYGTAISFGLHLALMNWERAHELTADRAGIIASGGAASGIRLMSKFMGANLTSPMLHVTDRTLLDQYAEFDLKNEDIITKLMCLYQLSEKSHPFTVTRIKAMHDWEESGDFQRIVEKHSM